MNESSTSPYSADLHDDSKSGEFDELVVRFLKELEGSGDPREVLSRYCTDYPAMAAEFRAMAAARQVLVMSEPVTDDRARVNDRLGDFRIVRQIAQGGMGAIYEAVQEPFERRVAVKTIRGDRRHLSNGARDRFFREQAVLARLHHTHIVPIHAGGQDGDLEYFAMQYIEGAALHHVVRSAHLHGTTKPSEETPSLAELARSAAGEEPAPQPEDRSSESTTLHVGGNGEPDRGPANLSLSMKYLRSVAKVMADAGDALHHAHEAGVIHRDVKPSNIMVDKHEHCWVVDFGLAAYQAAGNGAVHRANPVSSIAGAASGVMGTPRYMAPEQFQERADERTDVWGLGITLYELLTLRPAFTSPAEIASSEPRSPGEFVANLPRDLEAICLKALRKDPGQRYLTDHDFADDLRRWLRGMPSTASKPSPFRYVWFWSRRNPGWSAAAALVLTLVLGGAGGGIALAAARAVAAEAKSNAAKADAAAAEAKSDVTRAEAETARQQTRERDRDLLLLRIQQIRLTAKKINWYRDLWAKVVDASKLRLDAALQEQAAASLSGLDGRKSKSFEFGATQLLYDPMGQRLLMGGVKSDRREPLPARIWNTTTQQLEVLKVTAEGPVAFQDKIPVGLHADEKGVLGVRSLETGDVLRSFEVPSGYKLNDKLAATISADGALVGFGLDGPNDRAALTIWDAHSGMLKHILPGRFDSMSISPDKTLAAAGTAAGPVAVWSLSNGQEVARFEDGWNPVHCLSWGRNPMHPVDEKTKAPDAGWLLAAGDAGGYVRVWDVKRKILRATCPGSSFDVYSVTFSPDGVTLASCGRDEIRLWDLWSSRLLLEIPFASMEPAIAFSPDGRSLAAASYPSYTKGEVAIFDLEDGHGAHTLRGLIGKVMRTVYSPDNSLLAAQSMDWRVGIWECRTGRLLRLLDVPQGLLADNAGLAISPDNQRFVFSAGSEARLWNITTGRLERSWKLNPGLGDHPTFLGPDQVLLVRFETRQGDQIPGGGADPRKFPRVVRCFRLRGPGPVTPVAELSQFALDIRHIELSDDGRFLAISGVGCKLDDNTGLPLVNQKERLQGLHRSVHAYDPQTGTRLWAYTPPVEVNRVIHIRLDPTATKLYLSYQLNANSFMSELLDAQTGVRLSEVQAYGDIGPGARLWTSERSTLHEQDKARPLVTLDPDDMRFSNAKCFTSDGRLFTFGTRDGMVLVFDLDEVQRQLASVGLGW